MNIYNFGNYGPWYVSTLDQKLNFFFLVIITILSSLAASNQPMCYLNKYKRGVKTYQTFQTLIISPITFSNTFRSITIKIRSVMPRFAQTSSYETKADSESVAAFLIGLVGALNILYKDYKGQLLGLDGISHSFCQTSLLDCYGLSLIDWCLP